MVFSGASVVSATIVLVFLQFLILLIPAGTSPLRNLLDSGSPILGG